MIFLDVETCGLDKKRDALHGVGVLTNSGAHYVQEPYSESFRRMLADPLVAKCGHNILDFDIPFLEAKGFTVAGKIFDTRHMAYLIDENNSSGLKELTERYFGAEFLANKSELDKVLAETGCAHVGHLAAKDLLDPARPYTTLIAKYCIEDLKNTKQLFELLKKKLDELDTKVKKVFGPIKSPKQLFLEETVPFEQAKMAMQKRGLLVNVGKVEEARIALGEELATLTNELLSLSKEEQAKTEAYFSQRTLEKKLEKLKTEEGKQRLKEEPSRWHMPFSWTKAGHVRYLLTECFGLDEELFLRTDKGELALDKDGIAQLLEKVDGDHPALPLLHKYVQYKKLIKLISTYVGTEEGGGIADFIEEDGRVYPSYGSFQVTGRLSCSSPNIQQLPRTSAVKTFFVPKEGHVFLHFDASQIELRVAAHLAKDREMIESYIDGRDLHIQTAEAFFGGKITKDMEERQVGKESNFLLIFKGSPTRLQSTLKVKANKHYSVEECAAFRDAFFARYPQYAAYLQSQLEFMKRYGCVFTETGRMRRLKDISLGQYIKYKHREFTPPREVRADIVKYIHANRLGDATPEKIFEIASKRYSHATKQGYNFPIQGLAASIMKRGIIQLEKAGYSVVATVHDSVDIEIPETDIKKAVKECTAILSNCYQLRVPLTWDSKVLTSLSEKDIYAVK